MKKSELRKLIRETIKEDHKNDREGYLEYIHSNIDKCEDEEKLRKIYLFLEKCLKS